MERFTKFGLTVHILKRRADIQLYRLEKLIRTLAPKAVIFGREDIRWCGNEAGDATRDTEWNVMTYERESHCYRIS